MIPDYIKRLREELKDLVDRHGKLLEFIYESTEFPKLEVEERQQLVVQEYLMQRYIDILVSRLATKGYIKHD